MDRLREFVAGISPVTAVRGVTKTAYDREHIEVVGARLRDVLADLADQIEAEQEERVTRRLEDREAAEWVREHGGLEHLKNSLSALELLAEGIEIDTGLVIYDESPKERFVALRNEVRSRLMPPGMEWPRFEDDAPVVFGERAMGFTHKPAFVIDHVTLFADGEATVCAEADHGSGKVENFVRVHPGERVKRPDSWEQWRSDFMLPPVDYCMEVIGADRCRDMGLDDAFDAHARDMERRAKALAERGER